MKQAITVCFTLLIIGFGACAPRVETPERVDEPYRPPEASAIARVAVPSLTADKDIRMAEYRGNVVLVDFWATWCPPCIAEIPELKEIYEDYKEDGFLIVGMTVDEGRKSAVAGKVEPFELPYPVGLADRSAREAFGGIRVVPTKFLLDRDGVIRETFVGARPASELRAAIEDLL